MSAGRSSKRGRVALEWVDPNPALHDRRDEVDGLTNESLVDHYKSKKFQDSFLSDNKYCGSYHGS